MAAHAPELPASQLRAHTAPISLSPTTAIGATITSYLSGIGAAYVAIGLRRLGLSPAWALLALVLFCLPSGALWASIIARAPERRFLRLPILVAITYLGVCYGALFLAALLVVRAA